MTNSSAGIFSAHYRATTIGLLTAISACAFDQTAVTAVMPTIAHDLGNTAAYSATFVAGLAASILGMVASGIATDRYGTRLTLLISSAVFMLGLLLAVVAENMPMFLLSRATQGLGTGSLIVAIYATIAQFYPQNMRTKVFAGFAAAWVLPALLGPGLAGFLTVSFSWHTVFLLALGALIFAVGLLARTLASLTPQAPKTQQSALKKIYLSALLACSVALMNMATQFPEPINVIFFLLAAIGTVLSARPLVPVGTFRAARGIPQLITTRGLTDMMFTAEIYLPLLLAQFYRFGPTRTGIALTVSGVIWFLGSQSQARFGERFSTGQVIRLSAVVLCAGVCVIVMTLLTGAFWWLTICGWGISAAGMGFLYPRLSSEPLNLCDPSETGFIGSAQQIAGTVGMTFMLSVAALIQNSIVFADDKTRFITIFCAVACSAALIFMLWRTDKT